MSKKCTKVSKCTVLSIKVVYKKESTAYINSKNKTDFFYSCLT